MPQIIENALPICRAGDFIPPEIQEILGLKYDTTLYAELDGETMELPKGLDTLSTLSFMHTWKENKELLKERAALLERIAALDELLKHK